MQSCAGNALHKTATFVCVWLAIGMVSYSYFRCAARIEDAGLLGVVPWLDGLLRYTAIALIIYAVLTSVLTVINNRVTRIILITSALAVLAGVIVSLGCYIFKLPVTGAYMKLFTEVVWRAKATMFEDTYMCCGWSHVDRPPSTDGKSCTWAVTCDAVLKNAMTGKEKRLFVGLTVIAIVNLVVLVIEHVVLMVTSDMGYVRLERFDEY